MKRSECADVTPCSLRPEVKERIRRFALELRAAAPRLGTHGLGEQEFEDTGLLRGAIERLRGIQAASMSAKRRFLAEVLDHLKAAGRITEWKFMGAQRRHDYSIEMPGDHHAAFEAKGCLDGNNATIFERPANAEESFIWSLCQNPGADPRLNAWSGLHSRLGALTLTENQRVDAVVIWDMLCGTVARPCPKLADPARATALGSGRRVPPPCVYLFPRTRPDALDNPAPHVWRLKELPCVRALAEVFGWREEEIVEVRIQVRMSGAVRQRNTTLIRAGKVVAESGWCSLAQRGSKRPPPSMQAP